MSSLGRVLVGSYLLALFAALAVGVADALDSDTSGLGFVWLILVTFPASLPLLLSPLTAASNGAGVVLAAFSAAGVLQGWLLFYAATHRFAATPREPGE